MRGRSSVQIPLQKQPLYLQFSPAAPAKATVLPVKSGSLSSSSRLSVLTVSLLQSTVSSLEFLSVCSLSGLDSGQGS